MTVLTIAVSITAPALANFFRGRSLDSEARRLLALTRQGQSRAVSEGVPMELWVDAAQGTYGLTAEPSYEPVDAKAIIFTTASDLQIELDNFKPSSNTGTAGLSGSSDASSLSSHPNLPRIRFMPDGSIGEGSPQKLRVVGYGAFLSVELASTRLNYEIRTATK